MEAKNIMLVEVSVRSGVKLAGVYSPAEDSLYYDPPLLEAWEGRIIEHALSSAAEQKLQNLGR